MPLKVPASLVRHLNEGRCVLFVGAGLSAQAKLPSWGKLLGDLVQQVGADDPDEDSTAELKRLLDAGRFLDVADECKERLGAGYAELLSRALQVGAGPVPEAHRLVMQLPFAAWITTNYDKLLEQAYFQIRGGVPKTLTHLDADTFGTLLFDGAPFILKAHGDVDKPESLIFTTRDYREIIHSNPAFQAVFSAILLTRAVLFVGYSLNDPDFRLLLDRQLTTFKKFVPERYAIMSGVGDVEREVLRRTAQIKVISYPAGQHDQLVEFLRMLHAQVMANRNEIGDPLTPPWERTKAIPEIEALFDDEPVSNEDQAGLGPAELPPQPAHRDGGGGLGRSNPVLRPILSGSPHKSSPPERASSPLPPPPASAPAAPAAAPPVEHRGARGGKPQHPAGADAPTEERGRTLQRPSHESSPAAPGALADTRATDQADRALVLNLKVQGMRAASVLKDGSGEIFAQGTGVFSGTPLAKLLGQARSAGDYRTIGSILTAHLHSSVNRALENALDDAAAPSIALELDAELETIPWELLEVRGRPLALQAAISRAPVGLSPAARGRPTMRHPLHPLLVGDPAGNLPGARAEVEQIAKLYRDDAPVVLIGDQATTETVRPDIYGGCDVIHFAGHAWYDAQDVYLVLAGGAHLTEDLIRPGLSYRPPGVVMMNSHYTAFVPPGVGAKGPDPMKATGSGRMGFTDVLMQAGVGVFVGCFGSPSQEGATAVATAFHRALLAGVPAAEALRRARNDRAISNDDPTPLLYALSGYGDMTLG